MDEENRSESTGRILSGIAALRRVFRIFDITSQEILWPLAVVLGAAVGYAVVGFRAAIATLQTLVYGADDIMLHSVAARLPWYTVLLAPILGGLAVGLLMRVVTRDARPRGVADVIEGAALRQGRVGKRIGMASALAALITLSTGGSSGREGPAIHIGAVMASWLSTRLGAPGITGRDILGCAVAAAVSASFNAPIAGAIFALEVVLRHYALHSFGPIVIASVAAAIVSRLHFGDVAEFTLPAHNIGFYWELPAFAILGILSGLVGTVMMWTVFYAEEVADRAQAFLRMPSWLRPAAAGLLLGGIAIQFPHIIGVGYETTSLALTTQFAFWTAVVFAMVKVVAVAITFCGHMGGGIFSPALMLGALTGCAFGELAIGMFPHVSGSQGLYALAGMGAVAGAVLGAPISSTLIVFELTGDYQAGIAVMVSVSLASVISDRLIARSFFLTQLERQGLKMHVGPQGYLAATMPVEELMRQRGAEDGASDTQCHELYSQGAWLNRHDTLERALPMFEQLKGPFLPVMDDQGEPGDEPEVLGALFRADAFRAYTRRLEEELREEHG